MFCLETCVLSETVQVAFSPDGRWLLSASFDKSVKLWHGITGEFVATFRAHVGPVFQVAWAADSRQFVSSSEDSTIKVRRVLVEIISEWLLNFNNHLMLILVYYCFSCSIEYCSSLEF